MNTNYTMRGAHYVPEQTTRQSVRQSVTLLTYLATRPAFVRSQVLHQQFSSSRKKKKSAPLSALHTRNEKRAKMFHSTSFSRSGCLPDRTTSHYSYSCNTIFLHPPPEEEDMRIDQSWEEMASMNLGRNLQHPLPYIPPPPVRPPTSRALEDTIARHCYFRPGVLRDERIQDQYAGSSSFYSGGAAVAAARTTRAEGAGVGVGVGAGAARRSITYPPLEQNQQSEQARRYHHYQQQHPPPPQPPLLLHSTSQNPSTNPLFHYPQSDTYAPRTTTTRRRRRRRRRDHHPRKEDQQQNPFYNDNYDDLHSTFSQINSAHSSYSSSNYNNSNNNDITTFGEEEEVEVEEVEEVEVEEEPRRGRTRTRTRWGEEEETKSSPSPSVSRGGGGMMGRGTGATAVEPIGGYYYETRVVEPEWTR